MAHYHSEGLECLEHANEQHITENEILCPICAITAFTDTGHDSDLSDIIKFEESTVEVESLLIAYQPIASLLGRAPPSVI